jgi:uncharacterized protein
MKNWKEKLKERVFQYLKDEKGAHDYYHAMRTANIALEIAKKVDGDKDIIYATGLLHDIGYKESGKNYQEHFKYSVKMAKKWLPQIGFPKEKICKTLEAIRLHDNFSWGHNFEKTTINEVKIIQDADRIDNLSPVGILRVAYFCGEKGFPIYDPQPPRKSNVVWLNHSVIDQFKRQNLVSWHHLNFSYSKKISKKRYLVFKKFYKDLLKEFKNL